MQITVLGAGSWGSALAHVLAGNGQEVCLWDRNAELLAQIASTGCNPRYLPGLSLHRERIRCCANWSLAISEASCILIAVPSHAFRSILEDLRPLLHAECPIVWATKGLDSVSGDFLHQVVEDILGKTHPYAILSGPSFAKEVVQGLPTAVTLASHNQDFAQTIANAFRNDRFRVYTSNDIIGVQIGALVKNVLAVAAGVSDGLSLGANARAALLTRGLSEMLRLGDALGAKRETLMGLAGCGDIILSCTDNQSRNRRLGLALAEGKTIQEAMREIGQAVEAVHNIEQLYRLSKAGGVEMPIAEQVYYVMKQQVSPKEAVNALFARAPREE